MKIKLLSKATILLPFIFLLPFQNCKVCMYPQGTIITFTEEELAWIPDGAVGDSIYFTNGITDKVMYIDESEQFLSECLCAGPCKCCPEDDDLIYEYRLYGDEIPNTMVNEGFSISLLRSMGVFSKRFQWSCIYQDFSDFDKKLDSIDINGINYKDVFVKEMNYCHMKNLYFKQGIGVLRMEMDTVTWDRKP